MSDRRLQDLIRFYSTLNRLEKAIGGVRALADCRGRMKWPARGVDFFREAGENCSDTGEGPRVVRVGTHALKFGGSTTLWGTCRRTGASCAAVAAITGARSSG
jgi:hypothetical protein